MPALRTALLALLLLSACDHGAAPPPANPWAEVGAAVQAKDYDRAYALLEARRVPGRVDPELLVRMAEVLQLRGDKVEAILLLRQGLAEDPAATALIRPLTMLYLSVGEVQQARAALDAARAAGHVDGDIALLYGQTLARLQDFEGSLREFDAALDRGAQPQIVHYNRALVLGQLARHAEALQAAEASLAIDPAWAPARRERARAILDTRPADRAVVERALDEIVDVRDQLPEDWRLHETLGDAWMLLEDYDAAVAAYTDALRLGQNPKSVEERYRAAVLKQRERDARAAAADPK